MKSLKHKTRIEIIRDNSVISTITPDKKEGSDDYELSSSSSIDSFPTLTIKSSNREINDPFMGFSKTDIVRLSVSPVPGDEFITLFEGEFSKKTTKFEAESNNLQLEINAIHSFYMLSMFELDSSTDLFGVSFGELVYKLVNMAGVNSHIVIDSELSLTQVSGVSHNVNAFGLFKEVCLICDAVVTFNRDNSVDINLRSKKIDELKSRNVQTFSEKDFISIESEDSI